MPKWYAGTLAFAHLLEFCDRLLRRSNPRRDPFLARLSERQFRQIEAGLEYYRYTTLSRSGRRSEAEEAKLRYESLLSVETGTAVKSLSEAEP